MKNSKLILIGFIASLVLWSCQTVTKYSEEQNALLVGKVIYKAVATKEKFDGIYTSNITLTLVKSGTTKNIEISTNADGFIVNADLAPGIYALKRLDVKISNHNSVSGYHINYNHGRTIVIKDHSINNVGILNWYCTTNPYDTEYYYSDVFTNRDYAIVESEFKAIKGAQSWKSVNWVQVSMESDY